MKFTFVQRKFGLDVRNKKLSLGVSLGSLLGVFAFAKLLELPLVKPASRILVPQSHAK